MKYTVELMVACNVTIEGVEAKDMKDAQYIAQKIFRADRDKYVDINDLNVEEVTFAIEEKYDE